MGNRKLDKVKIDKLKAKADSLAVLRELHIVPQEGGGGQYFIICPWCESQMDVF